MKTKKQEELINSFLSELGDGLSSLYREIIVYLSELGYNPHKQRSYIVFKHDLHNKQISKIGIKNNKARVPFFALRFSACRGYSQRFVDIVAASIEKSTDMDAACMRGACEYCRGEPPTHVYTYTSPNGEVRTQCGASALEIPDITVNDIGEIKKLIKEEHAYLLKHQAGVEIE